jgi:hypothetical protein
MSDVITNSSSELFCTIFSDKHLDDIYEFFREYIGVGYSDESLSIYLEHKDEYCDKECFKDYPDNWIEIHMPYDYSNVTNILQAGLKAILESKFKDNYKIVFD